VLDRLAVGVPDAAGPEVDLEMADPEVEAVHRLLADRYARPTAEVVRFAPDVPVFRVDGGPTESWVVRIGRSLERYAATLSVLERSSYRSARVIPDHEGRLVGETTAVSGENTQVLVITHVPGGPTPFEPVPVGRVGAALGRLHGQAAAALAAALAPVPGLPVIERAGMLPDNELAFGLRCLHAVDDVVTPAERGLWQRLVDACTRGRVLGGGLTPVFLHGDAHPWNSVQAASGEVSLIDWDSAGRGPAVIDLAFLAVSCDTGGLIGPIIAPDPRRLDAVLDGYRSEMTLADADLAALDDAIAFRVLVSAAVGFGSLTRAGRTASTEPGIRWSLDRWAAAPRLADRMRASLTT
jgi:Ser/Thr protein kinase RdoA (MazF antagonist)